MSFTEYNKNGIIYTLVDGESFTLGGSETTLNIRSLFLDDNLCAFRGSNNFNYTYNKEESESDDIMADISKNRKLKKNLDPTYKLSCILDNSRNMQNDFLIANWGGIIIDSSGDIILDSSAATVRIGYRVNYDLSDNKQLTYKRFNGGWDENEMEKDIETGNLILDISGHVKFVNGEIKFGHGDYGDDNNPEIITIRIDPSNGNIDVSNNIKIYQKLDVSRVDISQVLIIPRRDNSSGDNKYKKSGTGSGISGEIYYDSSENKFFGLYDGKGFKEFGGGSSSNSGRVYIKAVDKVGQNDVSGIYFMVDATADLETHSLLDGQRIMKITKYGVDVSGNLNIESHNGINNGLKLGPTLVTSSAAELNILDGNKTVASIVTIADEDRLVLNDDGTMKQVPVLNFKTYFESGLITQQDTNTININNQETTINEIKNNTLNSTLKSVVDDNTAKLSNITIETDELIYKKLNVGVLGTQMMLGHSDLTFDQYNCSMRILDNGDLHLNVPDGRNFQFRINDEQKMIIKSNGNVGIGKDNPSEKLEVGGNIKASGTIESSATPSNGNHLTNKTYVDNSTSYIGSYDKSGYLDIGSKGNGGTKGNINHSNSWKSNDYHVWLRNSRQPTASNYSNVRIGFGNGAGNNTNTYPQFGPAAYIGVHMGGYSQSQSEFNGDAAGGDLVLGASGRGSVQTGVPERMRIVGNNGNVGIGTKDPSEKLEVNGNIKVSGIKVSGTIFINNDTPSTNKSTGALKVTGGVGIIGDLNVGQDITAYASSDKRLKTNIVPIENPLDKLSKINGYNFEWIENKEVQSNKGKDVGVIAQEINEILPEITITRDNGYMAVRYEKLTAFLVSCVKEQQKIIEEQKEKLNYQEKEILSLKDNIALIMEKINL